MLILFLVLIGIVYAATITLTSPSDNYYTLSTSATFTCNGSPELGWSITGIHLYTNQTGTWRINVSKFPTTPVNNTAVGNITILSSLSDGVSFIWNCRFDYTNSSGSNNLTYYGTNNKTVFVELPPPIGLDYPTSGAYLNSQSQFAITVQKSYTTDTLFYCRIYTNETDWTAYGPTLNAVNNTQINTTLSFDDGTYKWNAKCFESSNANIYGWNATNFTFVMDKTVPVVFVNFTNRTWSKTTSNSIKYIANDTNLASCVWWLNVTGSGLYQNHTNNSLTSGSEDVFTTSFANNNYTFLISCNDSAGNWYNSSQYQLKVDLVSPGVSSVGNASRSGYCDQWKVNLTSSEGVNLSVNYGPTTAVGNIISESTYIGTHNIYLSNVSENTVYYFNVTACDPAGNCNTTNTQYNFKFPFKVCAGWTYLGVYENSINMSTIATQSGADYVYSWKELNQSWYYYLGSGTDYTMRYGDEIMLYNVDNSTWAQNRSGSGYYKYNVTDGDNFIMLPTSYTFGTLAISLMNASGFWGQAFSTTPNAVNFNFTNFDAYNNSDQDWVGGYTYDVSYNWTWNNNTALGNATGLEVVWFYSQFNVSWNGTSVYANWTG